MSQSGATRPKAEWRDHLKLQPSGDHVKVIEQLFEFMQSESGIWAGYCSFQNEINFSEVYQGTQKNIRWVFPYILDGSAKLMDFRQSFHFEKNPLGFLQPLASSPIVPLEKINGMIVPGMGFDRKGFRLGRGQGYYDRVLENFKGLKVGVCFDSHIAEALPVEPFDVQMDVLVSEKGAIWFK